MMKRWFALLPVEQNKRLIRFLMSKSKRRRRTLARYVLLTDVSSMLRKEENALNMVPRSRYAGMKDVPTKSRKEDYVGGMVNVKFVVMMNVSSMLRKVDCAIGMVPRPSSAVMKDVPSMPRKEEYV